MNSWISRYNQLTQCLAMWAPLSLRLVLGVICIAHGGQKLFGWFDGPGFAGTATMFQNMGFSPGWFHALLGGGGEFIGGILVLLGLMTRFGAFLIAATMVVAIVAVHWSGGLFAQNGGFEYPLALLAAAISLICSGPGPYALGNRCCSMTYSSDVPAPQS